MKIKLLTAEHIYETARNALNSNFSYDWQEICARRPATKKIYEEVARRLNEDLGICSSCGARPESGLLEVAGEMWCAECCNPAADEKDPKIQLMHMIFNSAGEPVGIITPPAGMTLEDYKAQLAEEMKYIRFLLHFNKWGKPQKATASTIAELYTLINTNVPYPEYLERIPYYIHVYKKDDVIGSGSYVRMQTDVQVTAESGAAVGLNDALYEYAFNHR